MSMKIGDLVDIDPVFYGYDNIEPEWHHGLFMVIDVRRTKRKTVDGESYIVCKTLTPEGRLHDFYDYEIRNVNDKNDV